MANVKITALPASAGLSATDVFPVDDISSVETEKVTASQIRQYIGTGLNNASTAAVSAGYASDTYLVGSAVTIPTAGGWRVGTIYRCGFDITKTAAGTAASTIIVRMGTTGTTADAAILTFNHGVGTANADIGWYSLVATFRAVGAGTTAILQGVLALHHDLASTGLTTSSIDGNYILPVTSAGFNSTTQTIIGISFNGGASFSGTNTLVVASAENI